MAKKGRKTPVRIERFVINAKKNAPELTHSQIVDKVVSEIGQEAGIDKSTVGRILQRAGLGERRLAVAENQPPVFNKCLLRKAFGPLPEHRCGRPVLVLGANEASDEMALAVACVPEAHPETVYIEATHLINDPDLNRALDFIAEVARNYRIPEIMVSDGFPDIRRGELRKRGVKYLSRSGYKPDQFAAFKDRLRLGRLRMVDAPELFEEVSGISTPDDVLQCARMPTIISAIYEVTHRISMEVIIGPKTSRWEGLFSQR